jgi:fatty-acyl-CoA synthase
VAVIAANIPAMLEAHFGVPMLGAVLNTINTRLDAPTIRFILGHGEAKVFLVDAEFAPLAAAALDGMARRPLVVRIDDPEIATATLTEELEYEALLVEGDSTFEGPGPADEWDAIALNYTSGTVGDPKGVVVHHRGAFVNALSSMVTFGLSAGAVYLWTLPMFHCNGWCQTWAITALAGTHICLRKVDPERIFDLIDRHRVTHACGAPIVLNLLLRAAERSPRRGTHSVTFVVGGAAPVAAVLERMRDLNFHIVHGYGLTETYGPSVVCDWKQGWDALDIAEQAELISRQGLPNYGISEMIVADPETLKPVPADRSTIGEVMLRGATVMKGYLKNPATTEAAFAGDWFHTGDLAVRHPDGYIEVKDRAKDIIISGGENISSLEVEAVLYRHPAVSEAAVVAKPDEKWGETPCAFVALREGATAEPAELIQFCRERLAHFKVPKHIVFGPLPKTATGKIQKFVLREAARGVARP